MSTISVIQIMNTENNEYGKIIRKNSDFLENLNIEYIVYDNLKGFKILEIIKNFPHAKYIRGSFKDVATGILESGNLSSGHRLIYLEDKDILDDKNVEQLENSRINILREDLKKLQQKGLEKLDLQHLYLYLKKEKSLSEKIKLAFKYLA